MRLIAVNSPATDRRAIQPPSAIPGFAAPIGVELSCVASGEHLGAASDLPTTRWSLIRASGSDHTQAVVVWEELVVAYRPAILTYFKRALPAADAEDLCQSFIADSIDKSWWARADAERGSFRSFLFMMLRRFQGKHFARLQRQPESGAHD
jgi:hypothetical protein